MLNNRRDHLVGLVAQVQNAERSGDLWSQLALLDLEARVAAFSATELEDVGMMDWVQQRRTDREHNRTQVITALNDGEALLALEAQLDALVQPRTAVPSSEDVRSFGRAVLAVAAMLSWAPDSTRWACERVIRQVLDAVALFPERFEALSQLSSTRLLVEDVDDLGVVQVLTRFAEAQAASPPDPVPPSPEKRAEIEALIRRVSASSPRRVVPRQPVPRRRVAVSVPLRTRRVRRLRPRADGGGDIKTPLLGDWYVARNKDGDEVHPALSVRWTEVRVDDSSFVLLRIDVDPEAGISLRDGVQISMPDGRSLDDVRILHDQDRLWQASFPGEGEAVLWVSPLELEIALTFTRGHL